MGKSAWRDWVDPDDGRWSDLAPGDEGYDPILAGQSVALMDRPSRGPDLPREVGVYFGAQVGWSPGREGGDKLAVEWACDLATGDTLIVELCPECLSGYGDVNLGARVVCAACLSYSHDDRIASLLAKSQVVPEGERA